ncbi:MAG: transposase [Candidatus Omnitrophota bacterium]|nr:transposase [Candidatus Omnitrophota bacterium]
MPRKKRQISPSGIYHWIARGINRKDLFHRPRDYDFFLNLTREHASASQVAIYHYCLMTNHVHMLVFTTAIENLIRFSHFLKRKYAYYHSKEYRISGATFERMYRSKSVDREEYLLECARYIERNPLRAGLVKHADDYPYISFTTYSKGLKNSFITKSPAYLSLAQIRAAG